MKLNEWIRHVRTKAGLTQEKLGELMGTSKSNICHWETGKHDPSFAQVLKVSRLTRNNEPFPGMEDVVSQY